LKFVLFCFLLLFLVYLRFSPYFVRSSISSSFVVIEAWDVNDGSIFVSISFRDISSVCSLRLSFGITVVVDEDNNVLALAVVVVDGDDERDDDVGVVDEYCVGILDDGIKLLVVEASLTDGVVTDKAAGI
jgi:hypothetical protein